MMLREFEHIHDQIIHVDRAAPKAGSSPKKDGDNRANSA